MRNLKRNIKQFIFVGLLSFAAIMFTSCFDYVQSAYYDDDGGDVYCKFGVSKLLTEVLEVDPETLFSDVEIPLDLPESFTISQFETDTEVGFEIKGHVDFNDPYFALWAPSLVNKSLAIPVFIGYVAEDIFSDMPEDDDSMALITMMLADAKCRVFIDKDIADDFDIGELHFKGLNGDDYYLPVYDYGQNYCVEIPFLLLSEYENYMVGSMTCPSL